MATLTIRNLDDEVKQKIRERAAQNGISMEELVRRVLKKAVSDLEKPEKDIVTLVREKFAEKGFDGFREGEIQIPPRNEYMTESPFEDEETLKPELAR